jgi:hypothetical protein
MELAGVLLKLLLLDVHLLVVCLLVMMVLWLWMVLVVLVVGGLAWVKRHHGLKVGQGVQRGHMNGTHGRHRRHG